MNTLFAKIFGGINIAVYLRHLVFGAVLATPFIAAKLHGPSGVEVGEILMAVISTLLYPIARFVYESIVGFIFGNNMFVVPALAMLFVKIMSMYMCWFLAIFIAPLGLVYMYWRNTRPSTN